MKLIRYTNPNAYYRDFDAFFSDPFRAFEPLFRSTLSSAYRVPEQNAEWYENDENYFVRIDIPGVKREHLRVDAEEGLIRLSHEDVTRTGAEGEGQASRTEKLERVLRSPEGVQVSGISAKLEDGVLTLTLPKAQEKKPVNVQIQ